MVLSGGFIAQGIVRLGGISVANEITCEDSHFNGRKRLALVLDGASVGRGIFFRKNFQAIGEVRLLGASVGINVECDEGASFQNEGGRALSCDGIRVSGSFFCRGGMKYSGDLIFISACIKSTLEISDVNGSDLSSITIENADIGYLMMRGVSRICRNLIMANAKVKDFTDMVSCYPSNMIIDGFVYNNFSGPGVCTDAKERIDWLDKQIHSHLTTDFRPQPWEQLIKVLRQMGHSEDARIVAIEKQKRLYQVGKITGVWRRFFHRGFGLLTDYGYRPLKLVGWMMSVWIACGFIYYFAAINGLFGPSNPLVFQDARYAHCRPDYDPKSVPSSERKDKIGNWFWCKDSPGEYSAFSPFIYSLDVVLPVVSLGQEKDWGPITPAASPHTSRYWPWGHIFDVMETLIPDLWAERQKATETDKPDRTVFWGLALRWLIWAETLFGWLATLLLAAVLSGAAKKDEG